ncbi:MAG: UPF0164 family protein [Spirochaetales bacterium]|nr:UPF0164 family protein [Spirochaetales bacterium]
MKHRIYILFLILLLSRPVFAQDYTVYYDWYIDFFTNSFFYDENTGLYAMPILVIPGAGKYEAMGTAYTASKEDGGTMQANPAATALLEHTELAFSHTNWIADSSVEQVFYTTRFEDFGIGARTQIIYANFTKNNDYSEAEAYGTIAEGVVSLNASYNLFSSYTFKGIAVGANVKMAFRNIPADIYPDQSALAIMGDIGALTGFNLFKMYQSREPNFYVGIVGKNIGPPVGEDPLPSELSAGVSYSPIRPLKINLDFNVPFNFSPDIPSNEPNVCLGADLQFTPFLSLQTGIRYDGGNVRITLGSCVDVNNLTLNINYTHDFTTRSYSNELLDRISLQATFNLGDRGRKVRQDKLDELFILGYKAYQTGNYEEAILYFRQAVELDPSFDIAKRYLVTIQNLLDASNSLLEAGQNFFGDPGKDKKDRTDSGDSGDTDGSDENGGSTDSAGDGGSDTESE